MGQFAQQFKDYAQYQDGDCYRKSVPANLSGSLAELLVSACGPEAESSTATTMRKVADDLLTMAGKKSTANWEVGPLKTEIRAAFHILEESSFDKFMDATLNAFQRLCKTYPDAREKLIGNINDILLTANMGYTVRTVDGSERRLWESRTEAAAGVSSLTAAAEAVADISKEALDHLEQAKSHLLNPTNSRSRKDAVRDAMSAMEAMIKKLATNGDFDVASKKLRDEKIWGNDQIVKEGHSVWGLLHKHHPDIRHGQSSGTDINLEEAIFWIDRISAYVRYMASRRRVLGR
jgi:hypothetical protein